MARNALNQSINVTNNVKIIPYNSVETAKVLPIKIKYEVLPDTMNISYRKSYFFSQYIGWNFFLKQIYQCLRCANKLQQIQKLFKHNLKTS